MMPFEFTHLSGKVTAIDGGQMTIREPSKRLMTFSLFDVDPPATEGDEVQAIFGARGPKQRTFAALRNVRTGRIAVRKSHYRESAGNTPLIALASASGLLTVALLIFHRNHVGDLFSSERLLLLLASTAGWAFPALKIERIRTCYTNRFAEYLQSIEPPSKATEEQTEFI